jgi:hypothetical protein
MEPETASYWPHQKADPDRARRLSTALRQVEWAGTYLAACESLEIEDLELRVALGRTRQALVAAELRLRRLVAS